MAGPRSLALAAIAAAGLAVVGYTLYGVKKKHDLESGALDSAAQATAHLRVAAGLAFDAEQTADALRTRGADLERRLAALRDEDASRNQRLAEAAELYLVDVQAILRNLAAASQARVAANRSRVALRAHLGRAGSRGESWIPEALALKKRAERDHFDARVASGALAGLLGTHRFSQEKLREVAPRVPLLDESMRKKLLQAAKEAEQKAEDDLELLRRLPVS